MWRERGIRTWRARQPREYDLHAWLLWSDDGPDHEGRCWTTRCQLLSARMVRGSPWRVIQSGGRLGGDSLLPGLGAPPPTARPL